MTDQQLLAEQDVWKIKDLLRNLEFKSLPNKERLNLIRYFQRYILRNKGQIDG